MNNAWGCVRLRSGWLLLVVWACCGTGEPVIGESQDVRPNVLFISVDDLRPELNCYGAGHIHSPNIDRLAATGLLFQRAYCQQAVCNPSRTSLLTGLRPDSTGVTSNHAHFRTRHPNVVTLPQHFRSHGYHAQAIGKIFHGVFPEGASNTPWDTMGDPQSWSVPAIRFGPRYYYTEPGIDVARKVYQQVYKPTNAGSDDWTTRLVFGLATESPDVSDGTLYDGQVANAAVAALQQRNRNPAQPFFLAVGFIKPHSPFVAPKRYFDLYDNVGTADNQLLPAHAPVQAGHRSGELRRYTDQPDRGPLSIENQRRLRHAYFACVSYIDAQIGRVLDELKRLGLDGKTVVCLYGDHGYHLGEQGLWGKTTNFELDTRVPLIIRTPDMRSAGQKSQALVELVDLYPTLAELAGLPVGDHLQGCSLATLLNQPDGEVKQFALSQYPRGDLMGYSMRTASRRLTLWINPDTGHVTDREFYRYDSRLVETANRAEHAAEQPEIDRLSRRLALAFELDLSGVLTQSPSQSAVDR